jgi:hypothetical protein
MIEYQAVSRPITEGGIPLIQRNISSWYNNTTVETVIMYPTGGHGDTFRLVGCPAMLVRLDAPIRKNT